jgi:hypothetical protein
VVKNRLPELRRDYEKAMQTTWQKPNESPRPKKVSEKNLRKIIAAMDGRGAFVTDGGLKYHRYDGPIISMKTTAAALNGLADYLSQK